MDASCRIPFETLKDSKTGEFFPLSAALNENAKLPENLRRRYIVADLSTADENGFCRGAQEYFTPVGELSEFPRLRAIAAAREVDVASLANASVETLLASEPTPGDPAGLALELEDLKNYLQQVQRYSKDPLVKRAVFTGYCVGQTLSLCEIVDGQPKLVYRLVTSSARWTPQPYRYYAPINFIKSRSWSSDRRYTPADARRDARMGGGSAGIVPFANGGNPIEMPNFLHFNPMPGYPGETANGIHEIAGGLELRRNVRGSGEPGVHPSRQVPGQARPVVDADPGEVLRAFRAEPLPQVWGRGHRQGPRVPNSSTGEN